MSNQDISSVEMMAAEYALGSLSGFDREHFEKLLKENPDVERLVVEWQELLIPLAEQTADVKVPEHVLEKLMNEISDEQPVVKTPWWESLKLWRPMAFGNGLLSITLAAYISFQALSTGDDNLDQTVEVTEQGELLYVGVLKNKTQKPAVVVLAYNKPWRLKIESKIDLVSDDNHELRIWIKNRESEKIEYLATIPSGESEIKLTKEIWKILGNAQQLIVSSDPVSNNLDQPSGEILFQGLCINLKKWSEK